MRHEPFRMPVVFFLLWILLACSCSRQKLRLPLAEIQRPISLPPKTWNVGLAAGPEFRLHDGRNSIYPSLSATMLTPYLPVLSYPFFTLDENTELHFTLLNLNFYVRKNTRVNEGTLEAYGTNLSVGGGLLSFRTVLNSVVLDLDLFSNGKFVTSDRDWVEYNAALYYSIWEFLEYLDDATFVVNVTRGRQLTRRLYMKYGIRYATVSTFASWYDPWTYAIDSIAKWKNTQEFRLPITFGINLSSRWRLYCIAEPGIELKDTPFIAARGGFDFNW